MSRRHKALVSSCAVAVLLTGCSGDGEPDAAQVQDHSADVGFRESGLPLTTKGATLTFSGSKAPLAPNYSSMQLVKQWENDTNVKIRWENLPNDVYQEKKNLILASGDLPDAFYNSDFTTADIATYGTNGTLIAMEGLIDKYAPNIKKLFEKRPQVKAGVMSSNGHIYTLPSVEELGIGAVPFFLSINKTWLDKLGLEIPTTIDEYEQTLRAFKTKDPNGNGVADEIPLSYIDSWWCADIGDLMAALSGMPDNPEHRIVRDGKVIYTAIQPEYRQAIARLHEWHKEGLIDPEALTQDDKAYLAKGKTKVPVLGSYIWWETEEVVGPDRADQYVLVPPLEGVAGKLVGHSNGSEFAPGAFAITRANKYPALTIRWIDRLYDPVTSAQVAWGPIGVTLRKNQDGVLEQMEMPEGVSAGEYRQKVAPGGPHATLREDFKNVVLPEPRASVRIKQVQELFLPHAEDEWYPNVPFTVEESQEINEIETEITTFVQENRAAWIARSGVEEEWDTYTDKVKAMGVERLVELYQIAYDRYQSAS